MAIPPRMLPTATPMLCERAALAVMAISGRVVTIASSIRPPSASPRPRREESTSVVLESLMPATHTKAAAPTKISSKIGKDSDSNMQLLLPKSTIVAVRACPSLPVYKPGKPS
jgi:hypothetical protein